MSSIIRLSHTQKELFLTSPRSWFYKYKLGLQEEVMGSPLFFGSIVETGIDVLLKDGSLETAYKMFERNMQSYNVNGKLEDLATSDKVRYNKADYQEHLFTKKELQDLESKSQQFKTHQSLIRSGKLMIKDFHDNIKPRIKKVLAVQEPFSIENGAGDEIIGFADIICEWEDGRTIAPDLKTSSTKYPDDAVFTKDKGTQTALYYEALKDKYKLDATGFLVLEKKIRKKDPQTRSQILLGVPPDELIDLTFEQYEYVLKEIKKGMFPCGSPQCDQYGQSCAYKLYCQSEGTNLQGLIKFSRRR